MFLRKALRILMLATPLLLVLLGAGLYAGGESLVRWGYGSVSRIPRLAAIAEKIHRRPLDEYLAYAREHIPPTSFFCLKMGLLLALFLWRRPVRRAIAACRAYLPAVSTPTRALWTAMALSLFFYLGAALTTHRIDFGEGKLGLGYGHDGTRYGRMAEEFVPFQLQVQSPFCYRLLPSVPIFYLHTNTFTAFNATNFICYMLSCYLIWKLVRLYHADLDISILCVCLFANLKFFLKFWIYYPILTDSMGTMLMLALIYFTLIRNDLWYLITITISVFCRENLLALILFNIIYALHCTDGPRKIARRVLMHAVPFAAFALIHAYPLVIPDPNWPGGPMGLRTHFTSLTMILGTPDIQVKFALAHVNALGVLLIMALINWRRNIAFLRRNRHWAYYGIVTLCLAMLGREERHISWQAPLLLVMFAERCASISREQALRTGVTLLALQFIWAETMLPWAGSKEFYLTRFCIYPSTVDIFLIELSCAVFAWLVWRIAAGESAQPLTPGPDVPHAGDSIMPIQSPQAGRAF
jgi:hypothetical protein